MAEGYSWKLTNLNDVHTQNQRRKSIEMAHNLAENPMSDFENMPFHNTAPICRFYVRGICRFGDRCRFSHSVTNKTFNSQQKIVSEEESGPSDNSYKLKSTNQPATSAISSSENWVYAPEFIPSTSKHKSYAEILNANKQEMNSGTTSLCPYMEANGICNNPGDCGYIHCDQCDLCGLPALHPFDAEERKKHTQECIQQHERDMELSFAIARSKEKTCGVCFEVVLDKSTREQRFGILPNCNHCFCLACIRKWRQARQFENKIIRACPECRVTSDFVCPSEYWVETKEEKEKLITDYKDALSRKDCKYFKRGNGKCPFGNKCFYLHALPDGTKKDVGPPPRPARRHNDQGELDVLQHFILWDFLEDRESNDWFISDTDTDDEDHFDIVFSDSDSEMFDTDEYIFHIFQ